MEDAKGSRRAQQCARNIQTERSRNHLHTGPKKERSWARGNALEGSDKDGMEKAVNRTALSLCQLL